MKKITLLLIALLSIASASAQVKFASTDPDFKITLKRSVLAAKDVYVDMLFENTSDTNSELDLRPVDTKVYDDEGNVYSGHGKVFWQFEGGLLPSHTPVKCRLIVRNIDPNAAVLSRIIIGSYDKYNKLKVNGSTLINVPINKD